MPGPTALVTGGSRGIGLEIARYFAARSYSLILVSKDEVRLRSTTEALRNEFSVPIQHIATDFADLEGTASKVTALMETVVDLQVLVNAAGISAKGAGDAPVSTFYDLLLVNALAPHVIFQVCEPALINAKRANVFNISSLAGVEASAALGAYSASKFALRGYGEALAKQVISNNIRVTTVCPDFVDTDMGRAHVQDGDTLLSASDIVQAIHFVLQLSPNTLVAPIVLKRRSTTEFQGKLEAMSVTS